MDGPSQTSKHKQSSSKCRPKPIEADFFEEAKDHSAVVSDNIRQTRAKCNPKSSDIVSTGDIVCAIGQILDSANRSLEHLQPKRSVKPSYIGSQKEDIVFRIGEMESIHQSLLNGNECAQYSCKSCSLEQASKHESVVEIVPLETCSGKFWKVQKDVYTSLTKSWNRKVFVDVGSSLDHRTRAGLTQRSLCTLRQHGSTTHEYEKAIERYMMIERTEASGSVSYKDTNLSNYLRNCSYGLSSDLEKDSSSVDDKIVFKNGKMPIPSESSDNLIKVDRELEREAGALLPSSSSHFTKSASPGSDYEHHEDSFGGDGDGELCNKNRKTSHCQKLEIKVENQMEILFAEVSKQKAVLAKQEHAFSGALAGTCVSLCLHPVDTIKTVIQSCKAEQKSLYFIGQSIISERGLTGLYRGIASSIATSAPISAIYTFSYETVKGLLLPYLPKEYHSFAHCSAGGCASIATSFLFTPSDHIKQQMQVSPRYQNCWNAFLRIIESGGLSSLYTGWGAVLCRNIPHSIIKFYTYESLKQHILSPDQPKTWQTLLCGGLAGSTAALFSTPFDVVKTRYQIQVPGSAKQYSGVFSVIQQIHKTEGVMGLYRGLTPRLVMYMSQGALFFTSYEFFKDLFFSEPPPREPS